MLLRLKGLHDAQLLRRMHTGKNGDAPKTRPQILLRHQFEFATIHGDVTRSRNAQRGGNGKTCGLVITRDHHWANSGIQTLLHSGSHFITRRIHLPQQTKKMQTPTKRLKTGLLIQHSRIQ